MSGINIVGMMCDYNGTRPEEKKSQMSGSESGPENIAICTRRGG